MALEQCLLYLFLDDLPAPEAHRRRPRAYDAKVTSF